MYIGSRDQALITTVFILYCHFIYKLWRDAAILIISWTFLVELWKYLRYLKYIIPSLVGNIFLQKGVTPYQFKVLINKTDLNGFFFVICLLLDLINFKSISKMIHLIYSIFTPIWCPIPISVLLSLHLSLHFIQQPPTKAIFYNNKIHTNIVSNFVEFH